jgi:hypothetical protein
MPLLSPLFSNYIGCATVRRGDSQADEAKDVG